MGVVPEAAHCLGSYRGNSCLYGSPVSGTFSGILTSFPNCFLQVQLDNLPGMSLVAGKALSSARMSDAVLSQSSLMGSQQFQDGENEGKGPYTWGTPEKFLEPPLPSSPVTAPFFLYKEFMGCHSITNRFFPTLPYFFSTQHEYIKEYIFWLNAGVLHFFLHALL